MFINDRAAIGLPFWLGYDCGWDTIVVGIRLGRDQGEIMLTGLTHSGAIDLI